MSFVLAKERWSVQINPALSLSQMIQIAEFRSVDPRIVPEHFHIKGQVNRDFQMCALLIRQPSQVTTQEILDHLDRRKMRPANVQELLALALLTPRVTHCKRIFALGDRWTNPEDGLQYVVQGNFTRQRERRLLLSPIRDDPSWPGLYVCFACVAA